MTSITQIANGDSGLSTRSKLNKLITRFVDVTMAPFNAVGDGNADDTTNIQAAIDWAAGEARGVIFFPPGTYKIVNPLTYSFDGRFGVCFLGCGLLSKLIGSVNGFIIDRTITPANPTGGIKTIEKLWVVNTHASGGGIRMGSSVGGAVRDCMVDAFRAIDMCDSNGGAVQSWIVENCVLNTGGLGGASTGIACNGNGRIQSCDIAGFDHGIQPCGVGPSISDCRLEVNRIGIAAGVTVDISSGQDFCTGLTITGGSFESNGIAIDLSDTGSFNIGGFQIIGFEGAAPYEKLTSVSATTITASPSGAIFNGQISAAGVLTINSTTSGTLALSDYISGTGVPTGTKVDTKLSGTQGASGSTYSLKGSPSHGIRMLSDQANRGIFSGIACGAQAYTASIYVGDSTNRANLIFNGIAVSNTSTFGGATWRFPTTAHTANFENCNEAPTYLFAGLPTSTNRREGDQYYITDANTSTLGGNVTAGGSPNTHGYVTWNGSNWTLTSK